MNRFVQHVATGAEVLDGLTFPELLAAMEAMRERAGDRVEFTVIAHGKVKADE